MVHIRTVRLDNQWSGLLGVVRNLNRLTVSAILTIDCETDGPDVHNTIPSPKQSDLQGSKL